MISVVGVKKIIKESQFLNTYKNFITKKFEKISDDEYAKLLSFALLMFKSNDAILQKFGYNIIAQYSIYKNDLIPLYEVSLYNWNTPILKLIQKNNIRYKRNDFFSEIEDISSEYLKDNEKDVYYTMQQLEMNDLFIKSETDVAVIAPTSFGKTELLKRYVGKNYAKKNICIIVPTKVLINQLRADFQNYFQMKNITPKIVTHYDTKFDKSENNLFILTQERLFKLIFDKKADIVFDVLLIDEAHNIFEKDERGILLAKVLILLKNINKSMQIKYFSPIVENYTNLLPKYIGESNFLEINIQPLIKINKFLYADFSSNMNYMYDAMLNEFIELEEPMLRDKFDFIISKSLNKNILYFDSPNSIRQQINGLLGKLEVIEDDIVQEVSNSIKEYVHKDYELVECVKKGVVYHYGVMPDNVRMYVEECTRKYPFIKYVFCTSTLLEGVNMPFDRMFICGIKKGRPNMSYHQLKNLIGRVNRYSNIFNQTHSNINNLISEIYFVKDSNSKARYDKFIKERLSLAVTEEAKRDKVENPLLKNNNQDIPDKEKQYLTSLMPNINIEEKEKFQIRTPIGRAMLEANVIEFDIRRYEYEIQSRIDFCDINIDLIDKIYNVFIDGIELVSKNKNAIYRLKEIPARKYYKKFISWRMQNMSLSEKIARTVNYWKKYADPYNIFVGYKWGMKKRDLKDQRKQYIDISNMLDKEIVNYAILRLKEEDEYIDYTLMKFIELLHKFGKVTDNEYNLIQYGTNNELQIYFLKDGLSSELSEIIIKKYNNYIVKCGTDYKISKNILSVFDENQILFNELCYYIK